MRETGYSRVKKKQTALNLNVNKASRKFKEEKITVKSIKQKEPTVMIQIVSMVSPKSKLNNTGEEVSLKSKLNNTGEEVSLKLKLSGQQLTQNTTTTRISKTMTVGMVNGLEITDDAVVMRDSPTDMMKPIIE